VAPALSLRTCAVRPQRHLRPAYFAGAVYVGLIRALRGFNGRFAAEKQENQVESVAAAPAAQMLLKASKMGVLVANHS
jgi:hypothetical protein